MEHCHEMMGQEGVEIRFVGDLRKDYMFASWAEDLAEEEEGV